MPTLAERAAHRDYISAFTDKRIGREADCPFCGRICRAPVWDGAIQFVFGISWVKWCEHVTRGSGLFFEFGRRS